MRHIAAALLALAPAFAPDALRAQAERETFRGQFMEMVLPAGFPTPVAQPIPETGFDARGYLSRGKSASIALVEMVLPGIMVDTTLASRRAAFAEFRGSLFGSTGLEAVGEPAEILTGDRLGIRTRAMNNGGDETTYGMLDVFIARRGPPVLVLVGYIAHRKGDELHPDVRRFLDSARILEERLVESSALPDSAALARWIEGRWRWSAGSAADNPFTLGWSADRQSLRLVYSRPVESDSAGTLKDTYVYRVLGGGPGYIRAQIEDETRLDAEGKPVTWDVVWLSEDGFCWRRGDWPATGCTAPLVRLTSPPPPAPPQT